MVGVCFAPALKRRSTDSLHVKIDSWQSERGGKQAGTLKVAESLFRLAETLATRTRKETILINEPNVLTGKAHQRRACAVCQEPVIDDKAVPLDAGGGIEVLVHRACMAEVIDALEPKRTVFKVPVSTMTQKAQPMRKAQYDKSQLDGLAWLVNHADKDGNIMLMEDANGKLHIRQGSSDVYEPLS
jgi:hypothetical protein